jgi:hypothetical protein
VHQKEIICQESLNVSIRKEFIIKAISMETREMPWDYRWHNNSTAYNPDRLDIEIRRESLNKTLISWEEYFSTAKADVRLRKEMFKNSEKIAREKAMTLEK